MPIVVEGEVNFFGDIPLSGLPPFADRVLQKSPQLSQGLEIAQAAFAREGAKVIADQSTRSVTAWVSGVQREIAAFFGEPDSAVRQLAHMTFQPNLGRFCQRVNDPTYIRRVILIGQPEKEAHLGPSGIAETIGTGFGLGYALQTVKGNIGLFSAHDQASAESAALLGKVMGLRYHYSTILVGDRPQLSALGIALISVVDPLIVSSMDGRSSKVVDAFREGFYIT